jgi:hypothetical protein
MFSSASGRHDLLDHLAAEFAEAFRRRERPTLKPQGPVMRPGQVVERVFRLNPFASASNAATEGP